MVLKSYSYGSFITITTVLADAALQKTTEYLFRLIKLRFFVFFCFVYYPNLSCVRNVIGSFALYVLRTKYRQKSGAP